MSFKIETARIEDADQLLKLYYTVYGPTYPLPFGTDRITMIRTIQTPSFLWLVARDEQTGLIGGSVLFDTDPIVKIGKITGLVVHPEHRAARLASRLISFGTEELLSGNYDLNSIYTTTRTNTIGVQRIFLKSGYHSLGIFPNAHKLNEYETLTLFAKYRAGVLARRHPVGPVPYELGGLLSTLKDHCGIPTDHQLNPPRGISELAALNASNLAREPLEFELIFAPEYVRRVFHEKMIDPYDLFYPFHVPNFLMSSRNGEVEIYAFFSKSDRYCAIVGQNQAFHQLSGRLGGLFNQLKDMGASYLEILLDLRLAQSINAALDEGFVPSALYPAMRESHLPGKLDDFVVLSRTMEPLNFRGMTIDRSFKPFIDQYVKLWTEQHLLSLEVYDVH